MRENDGSSKETPIAGDARQQSGPLIVVTPSFMVFQDDDVTPLSNPERDSLHKARAFLAPRDGDQDASGDIVDQSVHVTRQRRTNATSHNALGRTLSLRLRNSLEAHRTTFSPLDDEKTWKATRPVLEALHSELVRDMSAPSFSLDHHLRCTEIPGLSPVPARHWGARLHQAAVRDLARGFVYEILENAE